MQIYDSLNAYHNQHDPTLDRPFPVPSVAVADMVSSSVGVQVVDPCHRLEGRAHQLGLTRSSSCFVGGSPCAARSRSDVVVHRYLYVEMMCAGYQKHYCFGSHILLEERLRSAPYVDDCEFGSGS